MWFVQLHWIWKLLIILGVSNVVYAIVRPCPMYRNPLRWGSSRALRWA